MANLLTRRGLRKAKSFLSFRPVGSRIGSVAPAKSAVAINPSIANAALTNTPPIGAATTNSLSITNPAQATSTTRVLPFGRDTAKWPSTPGEAARFLAQASMGTTRMHIALLQKSGYAAWINQQFAIPLQGTHYDWMAANNDPDTGLPYTDYSFRFNQNGFDASVWRKFLSSPDTLRQRIVLALSEILVVSIDGLDAYWPQFRAANYLDLLEKHAFGNYRNLLQDVSTSSAMAQYLTYLGNEKSNPVTGSNPDENYARELLQLFTIGLNELNIDGTVKLINGVAKETYKQTDISQLARVFTGWEWDPPYVGDRPEPSFAKRPLIQIPDLHETGASTFLGFSVPAGLDGTASLTRALDIIFAHPNVAPFVSRQLIQRLVTSNPVPSYVARVAKVFNNNGSGVKGDMRAVISAILLDSEARSLANLSNPQFGKVREPILRFTAFARAFNMQSANGTWDPGWVRSSDWGLGQAPLHAPNVFNFFRPGYVPPNSAVATAGLVAPELQLTNETSVIGYVNFMQSRIYAYAEFADPIDKDKNLQVYYNGLKLLAGNVNALVNEVNLLLAANQLSAASLATIRNAVAQIDVSDLNNRVLATVLLVLASPEFIVSK
jgi:uncharacterized protein (DUF1800 family)